EGTRVFSIRELSDINTKPAIDPAELQRQNRVLATLSKAASELVVHRPLDELFDKILDLLFEAVTAERGAILLLEGDPAQPRIKASKSTRGEPLTKVSRSIGRRVVEDRGALLLPDVLEGARFKAEASLLSSGIRSARRARCAGLRARGLQPSLPHRGGRLLRLRLRGRPAAARPGRRLGQGDGGGPAHDRPARGRARPLDGAAARGRGDPDQPDGVPEH